MIILLTGSPGGGKSLYAVSTLIPQYLKDGRTVYTNIKDLNYYSESNIHGQIVRRNLIKVKDDLPVWEKVLPLDDDLDWRDLPSGSVIVYDEAQQFFPSSGRTGLSSDGRISDLDTHRHKGYDIVYITQHPTLIDSHIRKFVSHHIHLYRKWGAKHSTIYEWNHCVSSPEHIIGDVEAFSKRYFKFDKKMFGFYNSSEIHTVKFKLPKKLIYIGIGFILLIVLIIFFAVKSFSTVSNVLGSSSGVKGGTSVSSVITRDSGLSCLLSDNSCSCTVSGVPVSVPSNQCVSVALKNRD